MAKVTVTKDRYTVDPLYQWDLNRVLEIRGLSLPSVPEIHFTSDAMDKAIVKQASMDAAGVITVDVPNSLLQKPYKIKAYVCIYEGGAFKSLYMIAIPVEARNKPNDYTLDYEGEVYSFNALENLVNNTVVTLRAENTKAVADCRAITDQAVADCEEILENATTHIIDTDNPHCVTAVQSGALPAIESEEYPGCYYREVDGEIEWVNPPLLADTEYKTVERYDGKVVYIQRVTFDALAAKNEFVEKPFATGVTNIVQVEKRAFWEDNGTVTSYGFPIYYGSEIHAVCDAYCTPSSSFAPGKIQISSLSSIAYMWSAEVIVKYTKD